MADAHINDDANALNPSADIIFDDFWTDDTLLSKSNSIALLYADLATESPTNDACEPWTAGCRIIINYEEHIHPLWSRDRLADTCINCHTSNGNTTIPDAQLELTDGPSDQVVEHFHAYRELLVTDAEQELSGGILQDIQVPSIDAGGNPITVTIPVAPSMRTGSARSSSQFFNLFRTGGTHEGRLEPAELKLLSEWLDLGGQYYNNPFDAP